MFLNYIYNIISKDIFPEDDIQRHIYDVRTFCTHQTRSSREAGLQVNVFLKQLADGLRSMKHIKNISFVLWYKGNVHA